MKNVVAISLAIFLVPLAGCLDELTEPTKTELIDKEVILPGGDFWRVGPAVGYGQFEWNFTHISTENESSSNYDDCTDTGGAWKCEVGHDGDGEGDDIHYDYFEYEDCEFSEDDMVWNCVMDFTWSVFIMNATNFQLFEDDNLTAEYFVNGSWRAMDGNGTKGPFNVDSSDGYYLVVANNGNNENEDVLRSRVQFYGWK